MGKAKKGKNRLDRFYHLAKEQGYRSRAAFKLVQLDSKYRFLYRAQALLDLCAAPGGWMQVAVKSMPVGAVVIGVDLVPIRPIRGALTLQEDITTPKCATEINKLLRQHGHTLVDVVLHDGSPNVGGAWAQESMTQATLVLDSLKLATKFLAPKGTFVTKVFRSEDYKSLKYAFEKLFDKVESTKPSASRTTSAEIYVVCQKYKGPGYIEPQLLDYRHLFKEIPEPPKVIDVLRGTKQKRHREGYDDPNTTFQKPCKASEFIWSDKPLDLLGTITSITFDDADSTPIKEHKETTDEIQALSEDLRVLGKKEFKQLLKWRLNIRKALSKASTDNKPENEPAKAGSEEDEEDMLEKMEELKSIMESKNKQAKKKEAKRKHKLKARTRTGMQVDVTGEQYGDLELFSLASIKAKNTLDRVEQDAAKSDDEDESVSDDEILNGAKPSKDEDESDLDSDAERERYNSELESFLDRAYDRYRSKREGSTSRRKRARMADTENDKLWEEETDNIMEEDSGGEEQDEEEEPNPLLVTVPKQKLTKEQVAQDWFSQGIFQGISEPQEIDSEDEKRAGKNQSEAQEADSDEEIEHLKVKMQQTKDSNEKKNEKLENDDFEVVPAEDSDESSSEEEEYDSDTKAEILAYAKKMLRKKDRERIIDDAYNRYMFNDEGLPDWFVDDEKKHCQINKPFTKEEVLAMKARFRAIDARPVKKVAEAKARKKRRVMKKMEQAKSKAAAIANQPDISNKSKNRMMEKVYKKAAASIRKPKREVVVAKKGVRVSGGKGKVVVDRRMKKDARSRGSGKPGKGGKPSKSGKRGKTGGKPAKGRKAGKR